MKQKKRTDRQQNILNRVNSLLLKEGSALSLKSITEEVNAFFAENELGEEVSQDEVCKAVQQFGRQHLSTYVQNKETWIKRTSVV